MVARFNQCCTRAEMLAVLTERASETTDSKLESHLEVCAVCREELERIAAAPQWWEGAHSYLSEAARLKNLQPGDDFSPPVAPNEARRAAPSSISAADSAQLLSWLPSGLLQPSEDAQTLGRIGGYEVLEGIGRGGMGVVLKALDPALNRFVALKVLASELAHNASARRRFAREAQAAAAVVHDHVVPIYAVDGTGPIPYLVMAYIPGRSLQERIDETGPLEVREILRIGMQTAAGLAAAHAQGLVHRDIKPANILLENSVERVRITDFGLARAMDEASQTQSGVLAGTPQYMAPEQASGEAIDYRTDLFSLGSVLYAMCTGHSPFRAETTVAVLRRICDGAPRPVREVNPDIPDWLAAIINKLLSKRPADRYGSAEDVARLLAEHLAQLQHPIRRRSTVPGRLIAWLTAGGVALIATMVFLWLANLQHYGSDSHRSSPGQSARKDDGASAKGSHIGIDRAKPVNVGPLLDWHSFDAELQSVYEELSRLEAMPPAGGAGVSRLDPLQAIDTTLDALESEVHAPSTIPDP
ncbi:MAG: serine/threonine-protein kinase [Pirellulales bacterium]